MSLPFRLRKLQFPQRKLPLQFLSYLIRIPAPTRLSSCHPGRRNQPVLPNFRNPILLRTDFDRPPPRYAGSRNQKEEQENSATFGLMILVTALRSDPYPSAPRGRILAVKIFQMTLGSQCQTKILTILSPGEFLLIRNRAKFQVDANCCRKSRRMSL